MTDWLIFTDAARAWLSGANPYGVGGDLPFVSPPHSLIVFVLLLWIPRAAMLFVPSLVLLAFAWQRRKWYLIPIVMVSFAFIHSSLSTNVDWMVLAGAAFGGWLGVIGLTMKPQSGLVIVAAHLGQQQTWRARALLLAPLAVLVALTLPLVPAWIEALRTMPARAWNVSLFPYSIPAGLYLAWRAWRRGDVLAGALGALALAPYISVGSLFPLIALVADRSWKWGLVASAASWGFLLVSPS